MAMPQTPNPAPTPQEVTEKEYSVAAPDGAGSVTFFVPDDATPEEAAQLRDVAILQYRRRKGLAAVPTPTPSPSPSPSPAPSPSPTPAMVPLNPSTSGVNFDPSRMVAPTATPSPMPPAAPLTPLTSKGVKGGSVTQPSPQTEGMESMDPDLKAQMDAALGSGGTGQPQGQGGFDFPAFGQGVTSQALPALAGTIAGTATDVGMDTLVNLFGNKLAMAGQAGRAAKVGAKVIGSKAGRTVLTKIPAIGAGLGAGYGTNVAQSKLVDPKIQAEWEKARLQHGREYGLGEAAANFITGARPTLRPGLVPGAIGLGLGAGGDVIRQAQDIKAGKRAGYDPIETALASVPGAFSGSTWIPGLKNLTPGGMPAPAVEAAPPPVAPIGAEPAAPMVPLNQTRGGMIAPSVDPMAPLPVATEPQLPTVIPKSEGVSSTSADNFEDPRFLQSVISDAKAGKDMSASGLVSRYGIRPDQAALTQEFLVKQGIARPASQPSVSNTGSTGKAGTKITTTTKAATPAATKGTPVPSGADKNTPYAYSQGSDSVTLHYPDGTTEQFPISEVTGGGTKQELSKRFKGSIDWVKSDKDVAPYLITGKDAEGRDTYIRLPRYEAPQAARPAQVTQAAQPAPTTPAGKAGAPVATARSTAPQRTTVTNTMDEGQSSSFAAANPVGVRFRAGAGKDKKLFTSGELVRVDQPYDKSTGYGHIVGYDPPKGRSNSGQYHVLMPQEGGGSRVVTMREDRVNISRVPQSERKGLTGNSSDLRVGVDVDSVIKGNLHNQVQVTTDAPQGPGQGGITGELSKEDRDILSGLQGYLRQNKNSKNPISASAAAQHLGVSNQKMRELLKRQTGIAAIDKAISQVNEAESARQVAAPPTTPAPAAGKTGAKVTSRSTRVRTTTPMQEQAPPVEAPTPTATPVVSESGKLAPTPPPTPEQANPFLSATFENLDNVRKSANAGVRLAKEALPQLEAKYADRISAQQAQAADISKPLETPLADSEAGLGAKKAKFKQTFANGNSREGTIEWGDGTELDADGIPVLGKATDSKGRTTPFTGFPKTMRVEGMTPSDFGNVLDRIKANATPQQFADVVKSINENVAPQYDDPEAFRQYIGQRIGATPQAEAAPPAPKTHSLGDVADYVFQDHLETPGRGDVSNVNIYQAVREAVKSENPEATAGDVQMAYNEALNRHLTKLGITDSTYSLRGDETKTVDVFGLGKSAKTNRPYIVGRTSDGKPVTIDVNEFRTKYRPLTESEGEPPSEPPTTGPGGSPVPPTPPAPVKPVPAKASGPKAGAKVTPAVPLQGKKGGGARGPAPPRGAMNMMETPKSADFIPNGDKDPFTNPPKYDRAMATVPHRGVNIDAQGKMTAFNYDPFEYPIVDPGSGGVVMTVEPNGSGVDLHGFPTETQMPAFERALISAQKNGMLRDVNLNGSGGPDHAITVYSPTDEDGATYVSVDRFKDFTENYRKAVNPDDAETRRLYKAFQEKAPEVADRVSPYYHVQVNDVDLNNPNVSPEEIQRVWEANDLAHSQNEISSQANTMTQEDAPGTPAWHYGSTRDNIHRYMFGAHPNTPPQILQRIMEINPNDLKGNPTLSLQFMENPAFMSPKARTVIRSLYASGNLAPGLSNMRAIRRLAGLDELDKAMGKSAPIGAASASGQTTNFGAGLPLPGKISSTVLDTTAKARADIAAARAAGTPLPSAASRRAISADDNALTKNPALKDVMTETIKNSVKQRLKALSALSDVNAAKFGRAANAPGATATERARNAMAEMQGSAGDQRWILDKGPMKIDPADYENVLSDMEKGVVGGGISQPERIGLIDGMNHLLTEGRALGRREVATLRKMYGSDVADAASVASLKGEGGVLNFLKEIIPAHLALRTSIDIGTPLRQTALHTVNHPGEAFHALANAVQMAKDPEFYHLWQHTMAETPVGRYALDTAGLDIPDQINGFGRTGNHDNYNGTIFNALESTGLDKLAKGEKLTPGEIAGLGVGASERVMHAHLAQVRYMEFERLYNRFTLPKSKGGNGMEMDPNSEEGKAFFKAAAGMVNVLTGKAQVPNMGILKHILFSPSFQLSRAAIASGPVYGTKLYKQHPALAAEYGKQMAVVGATLIGIKQLADMAKEQGFDVEMRLPGFGDSRSLDRQLADPNAWKLRIGKNWYEFSGAGKYLRWNGKMLTGLAYDYKTKKYQEIPGFNYGRHIANDTGLIHSDRLKSGFDINGMDIFENNMEGNLAPIPSAAATLLRGRDFSGNSFDPNKNPAYATSLASWAAKQVGPISLEQFLDTFSDGGGDSLIRTPWEMLGGSSRPDRSVVPKAAKSVNSTPYVAPPTTTPPAANKAGAKVGAGVQ